MIFQFRVDCRQFGITVDQIGLAQLELGGDDVVAVLVRGDLLGVHLDLFAEPVGARLERVEAVDVLERYDLDAQPPAVDLEPGIGRSIAELVQG